VSHEMVVAQVAATEKVNIDFRRSASQSFARGTPSDDSRTALGDSQGIQFQWESPQTVD